MHCMSRTREIIIYKVLYKSSNLLFSLLHRNFEDYMFFKRIFKNLLTKNCINLTKLQLQLLSLTFYVALCNSQFVKEQVGSYACLLDQLLYMSCIIIHVQEYFSIYIVTTCSSYLSKRTNKGQRTVYIQHDDPNQVLSPSVFVHLLSRYVRKYKITSIFFYPL